ncbi:MAG: BrnA antitoxin family protein [Proteobacteria bacterium]|nr:BrnA antitoxin family protein [Pseudomonadota bacterium]
MPARLEPLTDKSGEVRELTETDVARMKPATDAAPEILTRARRRGRPIVDNPKRQITLRLDPEIIAHFKAGGRGWQTRLNDVLARHVKRRR